MEGERKRKEERRDKNEKVEVERGEIKFLFQVEAGWRGHGEAVEEVQFPGNWMKAPP